MANGLFGFMFNTLRPRVNDPANGRFYLPARLEAMGAPSGGGKMLPLHEKNWNLGAVTGVAGSNMRKPLLDTWWQIRARKLPQLAKDDTPIGCPDKPFPTIVMPDVVVHGLDNVWLLDDPHVLQSAIGYTATVTVQFGHYPAPLLPAIELDAHYIMTQCACSAHKTAPTKCDGQLHEDIVANGPVTIEISHAFADVTLDIRPAGSGGSRTLSVSVTAVKFRGPKPDAVPTMKVTKLDFNSAFQAAAKALFIGQAKVALSSPDAVKGIFENLNATLNSPGNLKQLSELLTSQLAKALDSTMGAVPAGGLPTAGQQAPNAADQYLFDRLRFSVNDPKSEFYLPLVVVKNGDPKLDPLSLATIPLGATSAQGMDFQNVQLTNVVVTGLSNVEAPPGSLILSTRPADALVVVSALAGAAPVDAGGGRMVPIPAPPLHITGNFSFQFAGDSDTLGGNAVVTVARSQVAAKMTFGGTSDADVTVVFNALVLQANLADITIAISVESEMSDIINAIANQDSMKQKIVAAINDNAVANLGKISSSATDQTRKILASKLA